MDDMMRRRLVDESAEKVTLGSCLIDPDAITKIAEMVTPNDFYCNGHDIIYQALRDLYREGVPPDLITVTRKIGRDALQEIGGGTQHATRGDAYLVHMVQKTPTSLSVVHYATIVQRLATLRKLLGAAGLIAELAYNTKSGALEEVFAKAQQIVSLAAPDDKDEAVLLWIDSLAAFFEGQKIREDEEEAIKEGRLAHRVRPMWGAVKKYVPQVRPGMMVGLAAESGVGKTAWFGCHSESWAKLGLHVAFFHAELNHQIMLDRRMCRQSGESMRVIENGTILPQMIAANGKMRNWPGGIHYIHCPGWTAQRIVQKARMLRDKGLCDVMIVDYLQKIRLPSNNRGSNTAQQRGQQCETFKNVAEMLGISVWVGSQFSNKSKGKAIKTADDVRDTGELLEKANVFIVIDRPKLKKDMLDDSSKVIGEKGRRSPQVYGSVEKNTLGPTGPFKLMFEGSRFVFRDISPVIPPPLNL